MNKKVSVALAGLFSCGVVAASGMFAVSAANLLLNRREPDNLYLRRARADAPSVPVDDEAPVVNIRMSSDSVMTNETATVDVDVTDNDEVDYASVVLLLDGEEVKRYKGSFILPELTDGNHVLSATAKDVSGNEGADELSFNVELYVEPEPEVPDYIANANLEWLEFEEETGRWYYTVREGDYLIKIMGRINVSVEIMDEYNDNIHDPNLIYTGNRIYVTAPGQENKDKWKAGITFLDGHDKDELTYYTDDDGNLVDSEGHILSEEEAAKVKARTDVKIKDKEDDKPADSEAE